MESIENAPLRGFREEMEVERERQIKEGVAHLENVNAQELTADDLAVWEKTRSGTLGKEDLAAYERTILDAEHRILPDATQSRLDFLAFIRNKATPIFLRKELEKRKKSADA